MKNNNKIPGFYFFKPFENSYKKIKNSVILM